MKAVVANARPSLAVAPAKTAILDVGRSVLVGNLIWCSTACVSRASSATSAPIAIVALPTASSARMNELGAENSRMAQRVGMWDVVETVVASPGAAPTANKFVAERRMIGSFLQEIVQPAPGSAGPDFRRIYYLSFNRVEGRWKYVSIDTRNPVGLMPAASYGPGQNGTIHLTFEPFAIAGSGSTVTGQMLRMEEVMSQRDADHDVAEESFMMADGSGSTWLAYRYEYVRRP